MAISTQAKVKRIETIEGNIPRNRCKRHPGPLIFIQGSDDPDGQLVDKKVAEVERCRRCDGRKNIIIKHERFDARVVESVPIQFEKFEAPEPKPISVSDPIHFTLADGEKIFGE